MRALKSQRGFLCTHGMTSSADKMDIRMSFRVFGIFAEMNALGKNVVAPSCFWTLNVAA